MPLPIDFSGSLWFMPVAEWEWEEQPAPPPVDTGATQASGDAATGAAVPADSTSGSPQKRLVFKGYANSTAFHWFAADSALSRPWVGARRDDHEPKAEAERRPEPPIRPDGDVPGS